MSAIDDAAVLYLALNGWGEPITCRHIPAEDNLDTCDRDDIVAISSEDGSPLCTEHAKAEHGEIVHILQRTVLEEIKRRRKVLIDAEEKLHFTCSARVYSHGTEPLPYKRCTLTPGHASDHLWEKDWRTS